LEALLGRTVIGTHNGLMGTNSVTPVLRAAGGANMEVRVKVVGTPSPSNSLRPVAGIGELFWMGCCSKWWLCQPTHLVTLSIEPWI